MKRVILSLCLIVPVLVSRAGTVTNTDTFNTSHNYLTGGVLGTMWDGVYLGAGEFQNEATLGPGLVTKCDANLTSGSTLSLTDTGTAWENTQDDGFFLFKEVKGDFTATVQIVTPFNNAGYNTAGLQVRAFTTGGNPNGSGNKENFISWARMDEFSFANYLRSEVNGGVSQINPGDYPNSAYWQRIVRSGNTFQFYQSTNGTAWFLETNFPSPVTSGSNLVRSDLSGLALQVGIMHATFNGSLSVQYKNFSLVTTNLDPANYSFPAGPASGVNFSTNGNGSINIGWTPGSGSSGSVVVISTGSNVVKELPVNGVAYTGSANFGAGGQLLGTNYNVVYSGAGSSVTVSNITSPGTYNVSVYSYAGSSSTIGYNLTPAQSSFTIVPTVISAVAQVVGPDVDVTFAANVGNWYWLQYSTTLTPTSWNNVGTNPTLATSTTMTIVDSGGAMQGQRYYRVLQLQAEFGLGFNSAGGVVTSMVRNNDTISTQYLSGRLGDVNMYFRQPSVNTNWTRAQTINNNNIASTTTTISPDGTQRTTSYSMTGGLTGGSLVMNSGFTTSQSNLLWTITFSNLTSSTVEVGDAGLPLPMNTTFSGSSSVSNSVQKHHYIEGQGSFIFWMRPDSVGPYLLMTPTGSAKLEYWDVTNTGGFEAHMYSLHAASLNANLNKTVLENGQRWRQPNTSLMLAPGATQSFTFNLQWVNNYDEIRQALVNGGSIDVHVVPGMTIPTNLPALIALRTTQTINSVTAEFPGATTVTATGTTNLAGLGTYQLYSVQFNQTGENELTINYGSGNTTYLEFFITEPVDTLIKKRAAFLVNHQQIVNASLWYNYLYADINLNDGVTVTPDNHDTLDNSFQVYEIASDDAGESRPAFMGEKEQLYPVQSEVTSLDNYIYYFVWNTPSATGGLQRTTNETSSYGVYGVPDWHNLRTNSNLSLGRGYDYPHLIDMYYSMYKLAKYHPEITTYLPATNYLLRAYGTAQALWTYGGGQATQTGLMNELVISDLINDLVANGFNTQANSLRALWETKVALFCAGNQDLFASEYAFDATGFESQEAYAKYAFLHAGSDAAMGSGNVSAFLVNATNYINRQIAANVFDRGWLETCYYYYGSDYRGDMGNDFVCDYMSQMGGWGLLDYAFYYAPTLTNNMIDYLRLGAASYLQAWCIMNTGTGPTYGFWYPNNANYDGACGGGFEPSPIESTWLGGQPMHRGAWYYSAEENLGFCGAVRSGVCALADDPIFGRMAFLGTYANNSGTNVVVPLDGVRRRFHAMLNDGILHMTLDNDRFAANQQIQCTDSDNYISFDMESECTSTHNATLHLTVSTSATYTFSNNHGVFQTSPLTAGQEAVISLPIDASATAQPFTITH